VRRLPATVRGCDPADVLSRSFTLTRASWRVLWAEQSLILLAVAPAISFVVIIFSEAFIASIAPTAAVAMLVPAALAVVCVSMFWSAAIVAGANEVAEGRSPTVVGSMRLAAPHLPAICAWAFYSLTVGIAIRLLASVFGRFGLFLTYAGEAAWSVATMLVLPAIVIDGVAAPDARRHSRELLGSTWRTRLSGLLGFDLVGALIASPALLVVFAAALLDNGPLMGIALITCFGAFIAAGLTTSACVSVYRTMLYRQVHGRPVSKLYDLAPLERDLVPA
jgi:hypothetical protein